MAGVSFFGKWEDFQKAGFNITSINKYN